MSVKLRLMRMGKKKQPTYRIVAAHSSSPRDGRFIEVVGTYAPRQDPSAISVDNDKAVAWLAKGAQPTDTVRKLLEISGAWADFVAVRPAAAKAPAGRRGAAAAPAPATAAAPASKAAAPATPAAATPEAPAPTPAAEPAATAEAGSEA